MVAKVSQKSKRWLRRLVLSVISSPLILFVFGILTPTPANAEEGTAQVQEPTTPPASETSTVTTSPSSDSSTVAPVDQTTTTGGDTNSTQNANESNASEEVVLEAAPVESTQGSLAEAATAVATAESNLTTVTQELTEVQQQSETLNETTTAVTSAVETAAQEVAEATQAVEEAKDAIAAAEVAAQEAQDATAASQTADAAVVVAQGEVTQATTAVAEATAAVEAQVPVVAEAQESKDAAQAVVDANTASGLTANVYSVAGQNNAPYLNPDTATPLRTFTDTNGINEAWGGSRVADTNYDDVAVIWTGQLTYVNDGFTWYTAQADDGTKVYLDGVLVANDWYDKGGGGSTIQVETTAGQVVDFELWYYENGGGAGVQFLRYTEQGWVVETNFSTTSATPEQVAALDAAQATLTTETTELTNLQTTQATAQTTLASAETNLQTAEATAAAAETSEQLAVAEAVAAEATAVQLTTVATQEVQEAQVAVSSASQIVAAEIQNQTTINPPTNLRVTTLGDGSIRLDWDAPTSGVAPERYAVSWSTTNAGWGVASTTTSIVLAPELFETTGGWTTYNFTVRSDNDTQAKYSSTTEAVTLAVADPTPEPVPPTNGGEVTPPAPEPQNPTPTEPTPPTEPEPVDPTPEPENPQPEEPQEPTEPQPEPENPSEPSEPSTPEEPTNPEPEEPTEEPETPVEEPEEPAEPTQPEPTQPETPEPTPTEPEQPEVEPSPEPTPESVIDDALADGKLSEEEKEAIVSAILDDLEPGEAVSAEQLLEAGLTYEDLPPETPVDVRTDEDGNPVVITAEVAAALVLLENPAELLSEILSDPGQVLLALGSIGADMSAEERKEAEKMVLTTVVAAGVAMNAVAAAGAAGAAGSSGGGGSPSGGGGGAPVGREGGTRRAKPTNRTRKVK